MVLDLLAWLGITEPRYIPNAITGLFGFAGVVLTGLAALIAWQIKQTVLRYEKRNDLRAALRAEIEALWQSMAISPPSPHLLIAWQIKQTVLRYEKRNDLRAALRAEIEALWQSMAISPPSPHLLAEIGNRMRQPGGRKYTPHFSRYPAADIFTSMRADIAILGREEIPHVVRFYHHMVVLDQFVMELRDPAFRTFPIERKLQMTNHQFKMVAQAIEFAEAALVILEHKLEIENSERIGALKQAVAKRIGHE